MQAGIPINDDTAKAVDGIADVDAVRGLQVIEVKNLFFDFRVR